MYGVNVVLYVAILYVFVEGVCDEGLIESVMDTWSDPGGREIIEIILIASIINIVMCIFSLLCRAWDNRKVLSFAIASWVLTLIVVFSRFDYSLLGSYLIASVVLSQYLYSLRNRARHA